MRAEREQSGGLGTRIRLKRDRMHRDDHGRYGQVDPDVLLHDVDRRKIRPAKMIERRCPGDMDAPVVLSERPDASCRLIMRHQMQM